MRRGFTLVELLVVVSIIGILVGLLLPAVDAAREAGRRAQCANNLKQLALGCLAHEEVQTYLPTGGWTWWWAGDPDRGTDMRQPGGWDYTVLPYIGQQAMYDMGLGQSIADKKTAFAQRGQMPIPTFYCPTRRRPQGYLSAGPLPGYPHSYSSANAGDVILQARSDYAANAGTNENNCWWWEAPIKDDPSFADVPNYLASIYQQYGFHSADGVVYLLSTVKMAMITDGASNTYLLGEKNLNPDHYTDGMEATDNNPLYAGFDWDWERWASGGPLAMRPDWTITTRSAGALGRAEHGHCDGSVHWISYSIEPATHADLCSRNDGNAIDLGNTRF